MKKFMVIGIVSLLLITACDMGNNDDGKNTNVIPTLTIRNESSVKLYDVKWENTLFGDFEPGGTKSKEVDMGSGYVFFFKGVKQTSNDAVVYDGVNCRSNETVMVETGETQFNFIDDTMVVDTDDTANRGRLDVITQRLAKLTIQNNSSVQVTDVKFGGISFGDFPAGTNKTYGVPAGTNYLYFTKTANALDCHTDASITIKDKGQANFIFDDDILVVEIANVNNVKTLSTITRLGISGLTVRSVTSNSVSLSWSPVTGASGYNAYRSTSGTGTYEKKNTVLITETSYTDTSVLSGTNYYYKVSAANSGGESDQSDFVSALTVPSAPVEVNAEISSPGTITLNWTAPGGTVSSYNIYRSDSPSGAYSEIGISTQTLYTDTGLPVNTVYYYKVSALNAGGEGSQSDYTGSVLPAPGGVSASPVSSGNVSVSWNTVAEAGSYKIYRGTSADGTYDQIGTLASPPYADTGLSGNTSYFYKVSAVNSGGESAQSAYGSALTMPSVPVGVSASASSGTITVSWTVESGVTTKVYRSDSFSGSYGEIGASTTASYADTGLPFNATYYYKVSAVNNSGESGQSAAVSTTTMPAAPSGVSASAVSSSSISVTWTAVPGAASYQIYRSTSADYGYTRIGISTSSSYTNTGLSSNITYYYKVSAVNSAGLESPESSSVSAKTKIATPTWNSVAVGPTYVYLWWNPVWRAQGYRIYRSTSASGPYTQIGSSTDSYESYSDIGLSAKTTYYYKVSAFNNEGESELSEFYSVTTN